MQLQRLYFILLLFSISISAFGQNALEKETKVNAINSALHFANESAHGMLIVHRMLENYNQDINKYVDLESYKINFYSNKDLPKDIFEDPEQWFYDISPYQWFDIAIADAKRTKYDGYNGVIDDLGRMRSILTKINLLRFDLDELIIDKDLSDSVALEKVYAKLESGVTLYDQYYKLNQSLLDKVKIAFKPLQATEKEVQFPSFYKALTGIYLTSRDIMLSVRNKEDEHLAEQIARQQKAATNFRNIDLSSFGSTRMTNRKMVRYKRNGEEQIKTSLESIKRFYETAEVPTEYKQYGKFYYYYNSDLINKFNRYGNGMVFEFNNIIKYLDLPVLLFTEVPHYFKVIYPKKLEKLEHLAATDSKITILPKKLKDRKIEISTRSIKVDSLKFEVSLYDHMVEDGDIISLNFNGDWIVEKMPLTSKHQKLKLQLNEEGKNFFILHAENIGRQPPNTMALDYYFKGEKKQIILKSDLNVSEMIEIEYVKE